MTCTPRAFCQQGRTLLALIGNPAMSAIPILITLAAHIVCYVASYICAYCIP